MPITASAKKALRQTRRRRAINLRKSEAYKNAVKEYKKLIAAKKREEGKSALQKVYKTLDKAAKTGVISKNKASRLKSRFARLTGKG